MVYVSIMVVYRVLCHDDLGYRSQKCWENGGSFRLLATRSSALFPPAHMSQTSWWPVTVGSLALAATPPAHSVPLAYTRQLWTACRHVCHPTLLPLEGPRPPLCLRYLTDDPPEHP